MEMTSYSSVLTITGFTVERYVAICHPIKVQKICGETRAIRCIIIIWLVASLSALPYPIHTREFPYIINPKDETPIKESIVCNIPLKWFKMMLIVFQISTFAYFVLPMLVISVLYILIGLKLRPKELSSKDSENPQYGKTAATRARRAVLKMLVAVVVAFFVCWAPFHAQRLMTLYVKEWTPDLLELQSHLFYVSGVLYFLSSTINPILYNLLSRKFRQAFKRTLCRCCMNLNKLPTFYKLRAKFININEQGTTSPSGGRYLYPEKEIKMQTLLKPNTSKLLYHSKTLIDQPSTKDTDIKPSSSGSAYSSHAHSDGHLHYICRYKRCSSRRQSQLSKRNDNIASYQDIKVLRKNSLGDKCLIHSTYGTSVGSLPKHARNIAIQNR
ncbi:hypothetical protein ACJMK2_030426 [Sinanodonta woodiana]|uniref:G-protein coupled receptors family 1 profile domain-containing protein n=1 Tax=Sinanodonta woodiana TaxID=1069815 RepID=A0ABD3XD58_SINWO